MTPLVLKAGNALVPFADVARVDISDVEHEVVTFHMRDGSTHVAEGFDALEAIMVLKPSSLEGLRLRWKKGAWAIHNIVGHPVMQIMAWLGFGRAAVRFHDYTTPRPRSEK